MLIWIFITMTAFASAPGKVFRVVIDPGHGGTDHGTVFTDGNHSIAEKQITLLLAQEAATQLRAHGFDVVLTRTTDQGVPLPVRTAVANKLHADVFLSIHMNSTPSPLQRGMAKGFETYILNNTTDAPSKRLAQIENSATESQSDVALILKDLRLDANLGESKRLACTIQKNLTSTTAPAQKLNRGVKQALFYVLLGADMPSVLIEAGFLNSLHDRSLVLAPQGQRAIGRAIAHAIEQFRDTKNSSKTFSELSRCKVN